MDFFLKMDKIHRFNNIIRYNVSKTIMIVREGFIVDTKEKALRKYKNINDCCVCR